MLQNLFQDQKQYLNHFFDSLNFQESQKILDQLIACEGNVIFSGVGKSGFIAEKLAATFLSTGTRSFFLSPMNALHGDIGMITHKDILILLSKSGQSQELLDLIPFAHKKGAKIIAIVSNGTSQLAVKADFHVTLPVPKEICPFDLAPTTSTAAQLIFGDCLAVALMQKKNFSLQDYAQNHPSGSIGRKITLKVADIMLRADKVPFCFPKDCLIDTLHELSQKKCGCLLVVDKENQLKGIFTDGDLRRAIQNLGPSALQMKIEDLMTQDPKSTKPQLLAYHAMHTMEEDPLKPITVLPVVEEGKVVGLLRMHDILQKDIT
jgi:arabinose-5-phosphate isomerase